MARTVADAAAMFQIIAGYDPLDEASSTAPISDYLTRLTEMFKEFALSRPHLFFSHCNPLSTMQYGPRSRHWWRQEHRSSR
jgi:Asp-tRNA(Asn)/Glu-tRNA(Gln) amidotransferase A subunit family amidase